MRELGVPYHGNYSSCMAVGDTEPGAGEAGEGAALELRGLEGEAGMMGEVHSDGIQVQQVWACLRLHCRVCKCICLRLHCRVSKYICLRLHCVPLHVLAAALCSTVYACDCTLFNCICLWLHCWQLHSLQLHRVPLYMLAAAAGLFGVGDQQLVVMRQAVVQTVAPTCYCLLLPATARTYLLLPVTTGPL